MASTGPKSPPLSAAITSPLVRSMTSPDIASLARLELTSPPSRGISKPLQPVPDVPPLLQPRAGQTGFHTNTKFHSGLTRSYSWPPFLTGGGTFYPSAAVTRTSDELPTSPISPTDHFPLVHQHAGRASSDETALHSEHHVWETLSKTPVSSPTRRPAQDLSAWPIGGEEFVPLRPLRPLRPMKSWSSLNSVGSDSPQPSLDEKREGFRSKVRRRWNNLVQKVYTIDEAIKPASKYRPTSSFL